MTNIECIIDYISILKRTGMIEQAIASYAYEYALIVLKCQFEKFVRKGQGLSYDDTRRLMEDAARLLSNAKKQMLRDQELRDEQELQEMLQKAVEPVESGVLVTEGGKRVLEEYDGQSPID